MNTLNAIVVEDEPLSRAYLNNLLAVSCPEVKILSTVASVNMAVEAIVSLRPDLIFLDIELQEGTGFDVLRKLSDINFQVIFTTGLDDEAIKTIKISGVEYLQKPVDAEGLRKSVKLVSEGSMANVKRQALDNLVETLKNGNIPVKIMVQNVGGEMESLLISDIVHIEANGSKSAFILKSGIKKTVTKNLHEYEILLSNYHFFRVHKYFIINLNEIAKIDDGENATIIMSDESEIPLSAKRHDELFRIVNFPENMLH